LTASLAAGNPALSSKWMHPCKLTAQAFGELSEKRRNQPVCNHTLRIVITEISEAEFDVIVKSYKRAIRK
jgi:hypothetical protein